MTETATSVPESPDGKRLLDRVVPYARKNTPASLRMEMVWFGPDDRVWLAVMADGSFYTEIDTSEMRGPTDLSGPVTTLLPNGNPWTGRAFDGTSFSTDGSHRIPFDDPGKPK